MTRKADPMGYGRDTGQTALSGGEIAISMGLLALSGKPTGKTAPYILKDTI